MEIYTNLIPISNLGGIDLNITAQDFLIEIDENTLKTSEITEKEIEKDGFNPSLIFSPLYSEKMLGTPKNLSLYNSARDKQFAWFDGKVYVPRHPRKGQLLSRKERLWLFMTVRTAVEKRMMLHLECVKHSSK